MRVEPGTHKHTSTSGMVLSVDRPLSQEQVDLLVQVIDRAGQRPDTTFAIELTDEAGMFIEYIPNVSRSLGEEITHTQGAGDVKAIEGPHIAVGLNEPVFDCGPDRVWILPPPEISEDDQLMLAHQRAAYRGLSSRAVDELLAMPLRWVIGMQP